MADVTGTLHHKFGDKTYALRLTMAGLARLQGRHGLDLGGLLSGKFDSADGGNAPALIPPFAIMIDVVAVALEKGERMSAEDAADLADDMLTQDRGLCGAVMQAAFPTPATSGNGKASKVKP
ncbi:hypothetical protein [Paracoccus sp. JM45]|uniref:hypothetical protein n=1 Tax=Paracoccus sp. JM45 TaxID=2283626 RepID=UPI000E6CE00E|nr:hypothetical protein [Paracoccus sp. JM45]RJE81279.1 hypothetical protein DWB67_01065 [Paracoccus sp. JM45]